MAVLLTVSETLDGAAVADSLAGGGTGVDLGSVVNNQFAPLVNKTNNDGKQSLFVRHDATVDQITDFKQFFQTFGVGTGFTYGGADSAANDFTALRTMANGSGDSKNNADGNSAGFWVDMDADVTTANQFDYATNGVDGASSEGGDDSVRKFGDRNLDLIDLASSAVISNKCNVIDSDQGNGGDGTNGFIPNAPVAGEIGINGDVTLGDNAHLKYRIYLANSFTDGGIFQWELVYAYSFTA